MQNWKRQLKQGLLNWKDKNVGKASVEKIRSVDEEDYQRIYNQALKMFGKAAADKIQEIRDGKL